MKADQGPPWQGFVVNVATPECQAGECMLLIVLSVIRAHACYDFCFVSGEFCCELHWLPKLSMAAERWET